MRDITLRGGRRDGVEMAAGCDMIYIIGDVTPEKLLVIDVYSWHGHENERGDIFEFIHSYESTVERWNNGQFE